jgi:hypothetical protein
MSNPDNIIVGAPALAEYLYGDASKTRQIYHAHECGFLPIFKLGGQLAARPSTLAAHLAEQEKAALTKRRVA